MKRVGEFLSISSIVVAFLLIFARIGVGLGISLPSTWRPEILVGSVIAYIFTSLFIGLAFMDIADQEDS